MTIPGSGAHVCGCDAAVVLAMPFMEAVLTFLVRAAVYEKAASLLTEFVHQVCGYHHYLAHVPS